LPIASIGHQRHPAALPRDAIDFLLGEFRILHRQHCGEEEALRILLAILVGPIVVRLAHRLGADRVQQPWISIDVGRNDHHLIDTLDVHILQARLGLVGALVIKVVRLLRRHRGLAIEIAHIHSALDVVFDARSGERKHVYRAGRSVDSLRSDSGSGLTVND